MGADEVKAEPSADQSGGGRIKPPLNFQKESESMEDYTKQDSSKAETIARKNDYIRKNLRGAVIMVTPSVQSLSEQDGEALFRKIRDFNEFDKGNDPYGEHDFGAVNHGGVKYFFKFDYLDDSFKYFKEDGNRILTIMRSDEY